MSHEYFVKRWLQGQTGVYPYWYHDPQPKTETPPDPLRPFYENLRFLRQRVQYKIAHAAYKLKNNKTKKRKNKKIMERYQAIDVYLAELVRSLDELKRKLAEQARGDAS